MDKIIVNNKSYVSNEYLEYSKELGGEVSRANILFLLKEKKHSISLLKSPKNTDIILKTKKDHKKFYIEDSLFSSYSKKMLFDPILDVNYISEIERKWKREAIKRVNHSLNGDLKDLNIDKITIKKLNSSSVEIDKRELQNQFNKRKFKV